MGWHDRCGTRSVASSRHALAQCSRLRSLIAIGIGLIATGCSPESYGRPSWRLSTSAATVIPGTDGVHFVIRADPAVLAQADRGVLLVASTDYRNSTVLLPDDPDATGISTIGNVAIAIERELGAACPATGACEIGFTVFREQMPGTTGVVTSRVELSVSAASDERMFRSTALELQVDGADVLSATASE